MNAFINLSYLTKFALLLDFANNPHIEKNLVMSSPYLDLEAAILRHREGYLDEAESVYNAYTQDHPEHSEPWHLLGVIRLQKGMPKDSLYYFQEALKRDKNHVKCHSNLGAALYVLERFDEAEGHLRSALKIDPTYIDAMFNLGNVLSAQSRLVDASNVYNEVIRMHPDHTKALINLSAIHSGRDENIQAKALLERVISLTPNDFQCLGSLANVLERLNDLSRARDLNCRALEQQPDHAYANMLGAKIDLRNNKQNDALAKIKIVEASCDQEDVYVEAHFIKGQAFDALNRTDDAFASFCAANTKALEQALLEGTQPEKFLARIDQAHIRLNEGEVLHDADVVHDQTRSPVFFVGFPRSGTTLFEQMLASHPDIRTTNETSPLLHAVLGVDSTKIKNSNETTHKTLGIDLSKAANTINKPTQIILKKQFWREAEIIIDGLGDRLLIDSGPLNIRLLDIAERLFPDMKTIMIVRDPRDVCLSCFMQNFKASNMLSNFTTMENTVRTYDKIMSLWLRQDKLLSSNRLIFRYEDLVADMEGSVKTVLDFLGVEWSDHIHTYRNKAYEGHIITPSYRQVGEKLHNRSIGRWEKYKTHMEPFMDTLAPYVDSFGYSQ